MTERPEAAELLEEARRTLLEILLPLLPPDRRYDGFMVANAMAIASREARSGDAVLRRAVEDVAALSGVPDDVASGPPDALRATLQDLERRLARDIRSGVYDAAGLQRDAVRRYLRTSTEGRVRLSNPKALARTSRP